ncbi:MAG: hypothetical protein DBX58_08060 [Clostridiales bacterium]|nr:MAG: hypothetical protein DBX58_08060 [Clostridiales bacterium]
MGNFISYRTKKDAPLRMRTRAQSVQAPQHGGGGGEAGLPVLLFMKIGKRRRKRREENDGF